MLKQRVLTAIVLVLLVLGAILGFSYPLFEGFLAAVIAIAAWEWAGLSGLKSVLTKTFYSALVLLVLCLVRNVSDSILNIIFIINLLWWLFTLGFIYQYPKFSILWKNKVFLYFVGFLVLCPAWLAVMALRAQEEYIFLILLLLAIVAAADIGAYFSGRRFGKHKLAVQVSPNKTWEGVWGGMLACCLLFMGAVFINGDASAADGASWLKQLVIIIVSSAVLASFSVVGDLLESMIKRNRGVKDSGHILPGHGGILDRIDGMVAVAPIYALLIITFGNKLL